MSDRIDWDKLASRLQEVMADLVHRDTEKRYGNEFYAEALRRTFGYQRHDGTDGRELPYDAVAPSTGLTTKAEADHLRESHTIIDRLGREAAEKRVTELYAENRRVIQEAARDLSKYLREVTNDRTVPSRYRREGVLIAAEWLDPSSPANPHDYTVPEVSS